MLMNGVPLRVVSQRLGHHDSSTTNNIYAHVIRRADEFAAEALDKACSLTVKQADISNIALLHSAGGQFIILL